MEKVAAETGKRQRQGADAGYGGQKNQHKTWLSGFPKYIARTDDENEHKFCQNRQNKP